MSDIRPHPFVRLGRLFFSGARHLHGKKQKYIANRREKRRMAAARDADSDFSENDAEVVHYEADEIEEADISEDQPNTEEDAERDTFGEVPLVVWEEEAAEPLLPAQVEPLEELTKDDFQAFRKMLAKAHPKFKAVEEMRLDGALEDAVQARLKPTRKLNALLVMRSPVTRANSKHEVPTAIVVTGHKGPFGNLGINGVYELYPDQFHGRPVYQKRLEMQSAKDVDDTPPQLSAEEACALRRVSYKERALRRRSQTSVRLVAPIAKDVMALGPIQLSRPRDAWFLFFDNTQGKWCIGSKPEMGGELFARCPGAEEVIPDGLRRWEVWDTGRCVWFQHKGLRSYKAGY